MKAPFFLSLVVLLFISCGYQRRFSAEQLESLYANSVVDAAVPLEREIHTGLTRIDAGNRSLVTKDMDGETYIMVLTWKDNISFYPNQGSYNTSSYPIWVTVVPELKTLFVQQKMEKLKHADLRLKQVLGLPPHVEKTHFMEIWVRPTDIFRPCPDAEVTDTACDLCFPPGTPDDHVAWIEDLRNASFYGCTGDHYPWTQLGYTYDWHPKTKDHIGLSEFVIRADSDIYIERIVPTQEYLARFAD